MKRTILEFSLRSTLRGSFDDARDKVASALGCDFRIGGFRGMEVDVADVLGMYVALYPWLGVARTPILRLHTDLQDDRYYSVPEGEGLEFEMQDVSLSIIDLLDVRGAGTWYIPNDSDLEAEISYSDEYGAGRQASEQDIERWNAGY